MIEVAKYFNEGFELFGQFIFKKREEDQDYDPFLDMTFGYYGKTAFNYYNEKNSKYLKYAPSLYFSDAEEQKHFEKKFALFYAHNLCANTYNMYERLFSTRFNYKDSYEIELINFLSEREKEIVKKNEFDFYEFHSFFLQNVVKHFENVSAEDFINLCKKSLFKDDYNVGTFYSDVLDYFFDYLKEYEGVYISLLEESFYNHLEEHASRIKAGYEAVIQNYLIHILEDSCKCFRHEQEIIKAKKGAENMFNNVSRRKVCVKADLYKKHVIRYIPFTNEETKILENAVIVNEFRNICKEHGFYYTIDEIVVSKSEDSLPAKGTIIYEDYRIPATYTNDQKYEALIALAIKRKNPNAFVYLTQKSSDFGCDVFVDDGVKNYVIQAKLYSSAIGIQPEQEAIAAKAFYNADEAVVVTSAAANKSAINFAERTDCKIYEEISLDHLREVCSASNQN